MLSRYISLSQLTVTARRIHAPGLISVIALEYWWLQAAMFIIVPPRFRAASSGQGDWLTRCHEWRLVFMKLGCECLEAGGEKRLLIQIFSSEARKEERNQRI